MYNAKLDGTAAHASSAPQRGGCGRSHIVQSFAVIAAELDSDTLIKMNRHR
jgi:hypothetical protein